MLRTELKRPRYALKKVQGLIFKETKGSRLKQEERDYTARKLPLWEDLFAKLKNSGAC
jgi:hypothetical protein